jgi:hypothetical protein
MVVTATVEPVAKTFTMPRSTSEVETTLCTPRVRSMISPFPGVSIRRSPP